MLQQLIGRDDVKDILKEMVENLPSNKYDVGQKVISELCSKLIEQITAIHFSKKLKLDVVAGKHDVDPDVLFKLPTNQEPLEIKVAMGAKACKWRGGGLTHRSSDYLFVSRNRDTNEFFAAICYITPQDWASQKTEYFAPYITEEMLHNKNATVLVGGFDIVKKKKKGQEYDKVVLSMEKL
jgi:hypothetical protein